MIGRDARLAAKAANAQHRACDAIRLGLKMRTGPGHGLVFPAVEGTAIRVADPQSRPVGAGDSGEVLIRDDKLMVEHLDNPRPPA